MDDGYPNIVKLLTGGKKLEAPVFYCDECMGRFAFARFDQKRDQMVGLPEQQTPFCCPLCGAKNKVR
jgi:hypothetical protein